MSKIIFFLAGPVATSGELADIAKLNAAALAPYSVAVRNGIADNVGDDYGVDRLEPCDFAAGTIPTAYNAIPTIDPDAIPASLPVGSVVDLIDGADTEAPAIINADGKGELSGTFALIEHEQEIAGTGGTFAATVAGGVITGGVWTPA